MSARNLVLPIIAEDLLCGDSSEECPRVETLFGRHTCGVFGRSLMQVRVSGTDRFRRSAQCRAAEQHVSGTEQLPESDELDLSVPRSWGGGTLRSENWTWLEGFWHKFGILMFGDTFIAGTQTEPTIDPTGMELENCSEVDW